MDFREGDRVFLISNKRGYSLGMSNPLVGTPFECEGTVVRARSGYRVDWDNGHSNSYAEGDLGAATNVVMDPNRAFSRLKRISNSRRVGRRCARCGFTHSSDVVRCRACKTEGRWEYIYRCVSCGNELHSNEPEKIRSTSCMCPNHGGWVRIL
jgi:hypothetical protein